MTWAPWQIALRRWATHAITCRVCHTDDTRCGRGQRLGATYWQESRATGRPM